MATGAGGGLSLAERVCDIGVVVLHFKQNHVESCITPMYSIWPLLLTVASGEESGEEGEGEKVESLKAQQSQLEAEKQAILQNKELINEVQYHIPFKRSAYIIKRFVFCIGEAKDGDRSPTQTGPAQERAKEERPASTEDKGTYYIRSVPLVLHVSFYCVGNGEQATSW